MGLKTTVTIKQVAEASGVSIQTVSRVINQRYDVAPETRLRVQEAIRRLKFQPNAIARGLALSRSRTLGMVTYDFNDWFFTQVVTGAEQEAHAHDYFLMLGNSNCAPDEEPKYLRLLTERYVEGVLIARQGEGLRESAHLNRLYATGVPVVMTGFHHPEFKFHLVDIDNLDGGRQATDCLIRHGHRRIATITGPLAAQSALDRLTGYRQALADAGITDDETLRAEGNFTHRSGYDAMQKLQQSGARFSAVFCHNDRMAIGAISALKEAGLSVPEDVSIIGYDNIPEAEFSNPPLTTIYQPMVEVGAAAVRLLVKLIENPEMPPEQLIMGVQLVERQSVCQPAERWRKEYSGEESYRQIQ